jgi:large subunit ribosomal protein L10
MKSRQQKQKEIEQGEKLLKKSQNLIFINFSGATMEDFKKMRSDLKKQKASFKVIKKRLLKIIFQKAGIDLDPKQFDSQVGTVFISDRDIVEAANIVYKLFKEKEKQKTNFNILGGYDLENKTFFDEQKMKFIGQLPKREVVLAQVLGTIASPIKSMLYILNERSKKMQN